MLLDLLAAFAPSCRLCQVSAIDVTVTSPMPLTFSVPHTGCSPPLPSAAICCHLCFSQFVRVPSAHTHVLLIFLLAIASFAIDWRRFVANLRFFSLCTCPLCSHLCTADPFTCHSFVRKVSLLLKSMRNAHSVLC